VKRGLACILVGLAAWAVHAVSIELLFGHDVVALLLSPGSHSSLLGLLVAALFVVTRLVVLVLVPSLCVVGLVQVFLAWLKPSPG
jgi:hypothetical protein